jgi:hypothetical protein
VEEQQGIRITSSSPWLAKHTRSGNAALGMAGASGARAAAEAGALLAKLELVPTAIHPEEWLRRTGSRPPAGELEPTLPLSASSAPTPASYMSSAKKLTAYRPALDEGTLLGAVSWKLAIAASTLRRTSAAPSTAAAAAADEDDAELEEKAGAADDAAPAELRGLAAVNTEPLLARSVGETSPVLPSASDVSSAGAAKEAADELVCGAAVLPALLLLPKLLLLMSISLSSSNFCRFNRVP